MAEQTDKGFKVGNTDPSKRGLGHVSPGKRGTTTVGKLKDEAAKRDQK